MLTPDEWKAWQDRRAQRGTDWTPFIFLGCAWLVVFVYAIVKWLSV